MFETWTRDVWRRVQVREARSGGGAGRNQAERVPGSGASTSPAPRRWALKPELEPELRALHEFKQLPSLLMIRFWYDGHGALH